MALPTDTTQNDVITALTDALLELAALEGAQVNSGPIDYGQAAGDLVCVLGIQNGNESWEGLGNHKRSETYDIDMACLAVRDRAPGNPEPTIRASRDAAYALHAAVAGYVRSNPHLGGVTIKQMSGTNLDQGYDAQARWTRLDWSIRVTAQIEVV